MQINLKGTKIKLTKAIKDYVQEKMDMLEKYLGKIQVINCKVEVGMVVGGQNNGDAINKNQVLGVVVSDFKHLEIWRQIFTTPSILISIFVTLILFDFAFSYKKKDDNKEPIKENKKSIETKEDINFDLPKPATFNAKDTQYILELTQKIDLPKLRTALKNDEKMPKLTSKEINNLDNKLKECPDKLPDLKTKEKDFLEYTIRLDLSELQKNINKKINRGE
jgi:ribosomal subunit interface protein